MRRRFLVAMAASAAVLLGVGIAPAQAAGKPGSFDRYSFTNDQGTRAYKVFVPRSWTGRSMPLVVELHGCGSSPDAEAHATRLNDFAAKRGFLVAYPEQDLAANGTGCWNWFLPAHQTRGSGEPSIIAGITAAVQKRWNADKRRTYVGGISAGAGMAMNLTVTYPDVYAAGLIDAGCEYKGTTCFGAPGAVPPDVSGDLAFSEMGPRARVVPLMLAHGTLDFTVPPIDSDEIAQAALRIVDNVEGAAGRPTGVARTAARKRTDTSPGGVTSDVKVFTDLKGCPVVEQWLVHGMGHEWSKAPPDDSGNATFVNGPDITAAALSFYLQHPMPTRTTGCYTGR